MKTLRGDDQTTDRLVLDAAFVMRSLRAYGGWAGAAYDSPLARAAASYPDRFIVLYSRRGYGSVAIFAKIRRATP
jgi:non-ribosomal peptide synthetase component E (peptide arylation enzyme)